MTNTTVKKIQWYLITTVTHQTISTYLYIIQSPDLTRNKGIHCVLMATKGIIFFQEKPNDQSLHMTLKKYFIIQNSRKCNTKNIHTYTSRNFE